MQHSLISVYDMKAAAFAFLLAVCVVVMHARSRTARSADVTIGMSEGTPESRGSRVLHISFQKASLCDR